MSATEPKKKSLYTELRKDLLEAGLTVSLDESLICPLCWQEKKLSDMSLEHIVPQSAGGRSCTLSCKLCNNTDGSKYDSHLANLLKTENSMLEEGKIKARLSVEGKDVAANVSFSNGEVKMEVVGQASNPANIDSLSNDLPRVSPETSIQLRMDFGFNKKNLLAATVRCAYLAAFKERGYKYIHLDALQCIRKKLHDQSIETPDFKTMITGGVDDWPWPDEPFVLKEIHIKGYPVLAVFLRLKANGKENISTRIVLLPTPEDEAVFFDKMKEFAAEPGGKVELTIKQPQQVDDC